MSILSDRQIRALCVAPTTYFDRAGYDKELADTLASPLNPEPLIHHATFGAMQEAAADKARERMARHTRPTTNEERAAFRPMITPYVDESVRSVDLGTKVVESFVVPIPPRKVLSFGTSSFGYDVRLAEAFKIFSNINAGVIDPKKLDELCLMDAAIKEDLDGSKYVLLPPNSYLLGHTVETFDIPRDVMVVCVGKSTYARAGAIVNVTPIEPGFQGTVVIEISNSTNLPLKIYANEGIAQFLFFQGSEACQVSYADRDGKYQGQLGVTLPKV